MNSHRRRRGALAVKRAIDVATSVVLLGLCSPLIAAAMLAVRLVMGRGVFFRQRRTGLGGRLFSVWKLRTMANLEDPQGRRLSDADRLTGLGRLLRATSVDELPQLWNVLTGDMSLVGPRPLLPEYLPRYNAFQRRRHEMKPGITGWAQINGRNALTWERKFELDVWYVDNWTLRLDLAILAKTVKAILRRDRISHADNATMPEFLGSN